MPAVWPVARRPVTFFDLEDPTDEARLADPKLALESLDGLVVIDEVQHSEGLFRLLRVLVDRPSNRAWFLVLGSAGPELLRQSSESLAGRIAYHELPPLQVDETGAGSIDRLWIRGGFPLSFLAPDEERSVGWRRAFVRTFLERDLPQLGIKVPAWEGFAMHEAVRILSVDWEDCHYWATHSGAEIDLLVFDGGRRIGFEFKRTSAPRMTRSMHSALADLRLDRIFVIFPGRPPLPAARTRRGGGTGASLRRRVCLTRCRAPQGSPARRECRARRRSAPTDSEVR